MPSSPRVNVKFPVTHNMNLEDDDGPPLLVGVGEAENGKEVAKPAKVPITIVTGASSFFI